MIILQQEIHFKVVLLQRERVFRPACKEGADSLGYAVNIIERCRKAPLPSWSIRGRLLRIEGEKIRLSPDAAKIISNLYVERIGV